MALLLARGADPCVRNDSGWTALTLAAFSGQLLIVRRLLQAMVTPLGRCKGHFQVASHSLTSA